MHSSEHLKNSLTYLILNNPMRQVLFYPHFTGEDTSAQMSCLALEPGFKSMLPDSGACALNHYAILPFRKMSLPEYSSHHRSSCSDLFKLLCSLPFTVSSLQPPGVFYCLNNRTHKTRQRSLQGNDGFVSLLFVPWFFIF